MSKSQLEKDLEIKESFIDLLNDIYPTVRLVTQLLHPPKF